ncbi:MAG TPA: lipopolysaccharide heptosyltransferase I [Vicinamibacterales bacterium]|nr:lipopolysaccharide heptosyltransferase I [Vicinamibacterales bacterium]
MNDPQPRFLIVRLGSLGDVIHAIPAVAALRRRHPAARIDWIVDPQYLELLTLVAGIDHCIPLDPRASWSGLLKAVRDLRRVHYEAAADLQGLLKSALLARAAGARRTLGFPRAHLREPLAGVFYSETPDVGDRPHVIHKGLALMRALGVQDADVVFPISIPASRAAAAVREQMGPRYVVINPGAAWPNKRWPPDRFGALAAALAERRGLRSAVLWGPGEESMAAAVVAASRGAAELLPPTSITDIVAIAKGASLMVSGDTGPLHIGAAVGTPIVALFGPTSAERNGPWAASDISISRFDRCACHYERQCRRSQSCIDDISVDEVMAAIERRVAAR